MDDSKLKLTSKCMKTLGKAKQTSAQVKMSRESTRRSVFRRMLNCG